MLPTLLPDSHGVDGRTEVGSSALVNCYFLSHCTRILTFEFGLLSGSRRVTGSSLCRSAISSGVSAAARQHRLPVMQTARSGVGRANRVCRNSFYAYSRSLAPAAPTNHVVWTRRMHFQHVHERDHSSASRRHRAPCIQGWKCFQIIIAKPHMFKRSIRRDLQPYLSRRCISVLSIRPTS